MNKNVLFVASLCQSSIHRQCLAQAPAVLDFLTLTKRFQAEKTKSAHRRHPDPPGK
jgi:hypothetical protein